MHKTTSDMTAQIYPSFRFEADMTGPVARWLLSSGLSVKSEFVLPWGVCDLVGVKLNSSKSRQRLAYGQTRSIGSLFRLLLLSKIPDQKTGQSIGLKRLRADLDCGFSDEVISSEVRKLEHGKFVTFPKPGFVQKLNGWVPLHTRVVAVELKLARVAEALSQAIANREFATHSYVALPMQIATRLSHSQTRHAFTSRGVGLLGVSPDFCRELIAPKLARTSSNELIQMHVVERFWGSRGSSPSVVLR